MLSGGAPIFKSFKVDGGDARKNRGAAQEMGMVGQHF
jgi:hypothetical protein